MYSTFTIAFSEYSANWQTELSPNTLTIFDMCMTLYQDKSNGMFVDFPLYMLNGIIYDVQLKGIIEYVFRRQLCFSEAQLNTLRPRQNGRHFADNIFKCIFLNKNVRISLTISLKFIPEVRINNIPALVQIMAWRRSGDKSLTKPMMVSLLTHICVTRPQWVNTYIHKIVFAYVSDHQIIVYHTTIKVG